MANLEIKYDIKGYQTYTLNDGDIYFDLDEKYLPSVDYFRIEYFLLTYFIYNTFVHIPFVVLSYVPIINWIAYPISWIMSCYGIGLLVSIWVMMLIGCVEGYKIRQEMIASGKEFTSNIIYHITWQCDTKFISSCTLYCPNIYDSVPKWVYVWYDRIEYFINLPLWTYCMQELCSYLDGISYCNLLTPYNNLIRSMYNDIIMTKNQHSDNNKHDKSD
jgi:hypothetical protein